MENSMENGKLTTVVHPPSPIANASLSIVHSLLSLAHHPSNIAQHFRALGVQRGDFVHDFLRAAVRDFLAAVGVLHGQIRFGRGQRPVWFSYVHAPAFGRVCFGLLQGDELGEVGVVERVGLP